ncbi:hypothetical protein D915_005009 [Fasciola hepatica]|uniref:BRCT domain-containing protein n=1 Tax=Fasciola hepatica TaxID=6192 RepID=A0A4E0RAA5_FASHE|nr:hypothetical protein D915_005009 [Fasciola hepatica]
MSSNIIPSPESNPPPPVQCILTRGSDQLHMKRVTVTSVNGSPALDHNTFESFLGEMDDESPPADGGRTFTQVDDFREAPVNLPRISLDAHSEEPSMSLLWPRDRVSESPPGSIPNARSSCVSDRPADDQETPILFETSDATTSVIKDAPHLESGKFKSGDKAMNTVSSNAQPASPSGGVTHPQESSSSAALSNETTSVVGDSQPKPESSISIAPDNPRTIVMSPRSEKPIHKCLVSAQLSITSHPLDSSTGTGSMESKQLFFYGFSTQLDSVPNQASLMHIRPQFNDMFSRVDTFWQSFINSNRTSDLFTASGDTCTDLRHNRPCSLNACQQQVVESNLPVCASSSVYQIENPGQSVKDEGVRPTRAGLPVYGRWHSEPYYYAGWIPEHTQAGLRQWVMFDDGSKARLRVTDILLLELLPINTKVYVDWNDSCEYQGSCLITAHTDNPMKPYEIRRESDGFRRMFPRKNVAIHHIELCHLRDQGQLPPSTSEQSLRVALVKSIQTKQLSVTLFPTDEHSTIADISLTNMVFGKRERKRKQPIDEVQKGTDSEKKPLLSQNTPPSKRVRLTNRHGRPGRSVPRTPSRRVRCRTGSESDEEGLTQPMHDKGQSLQLRDPSVFRMSSVAASANYYLRRSLCRSLNLPLPSASLFQGWTVIFTGRFPHIYTSPAGSSGGDREVLQKLVLATGGQVSTPIFSDLLGQEDKENNDDPLGGGRHVALVATEPCRTLKYFQALATLGRVPLLRSKWILDVVRREAAEAQEREDIGDEELSLNSRKAKCNNWPLRLLMDRPGRYELPRGVLDAPEELVSWCAIPIHYRSTLRDIMPSPSLFEIPVDWSTKPCRLISIVTDDTNVFGPAWLTILQLAHGAKLVPGTMDPQPASVTDLQRIPVLSMQNAVQCLSSLLPSSSNTHCSRGNLVLVDRNKLDAYILSELRLLPVQLVTCDYFIQSLICGQLLDPDSSSIFVPEVG